MIHMMLLKGIASVLWNQALVILKRENNKHNWAYCESFNEFFSLSRLGI